MFPTELRAQPTNVLGFHVTWNLRKGLTKINLLSQVIDRHGQTHAPVSVAFFVIEGFTESISQQLDCGSIIKNMYWCGYHLKHMGCERKVMVCEGTL